MSRAVASNRLVTDGFDGTWAELGAIDLPPAAAAFCAGHREALRAVWQHATHPGTELLVASAGRKEEGLVAALSELGLAIVDLDGDDIAIAPAAAPRDPLPGRVWLLTSGSTGRPKQVAHTLDSLTTVKGEQPARTWLCPYTPGAYAWWQVTTLGLFQPGQKVVYVDPAHAEDWPLVARAHGVDAASGTPTFWRQALMRHGDVLAEVGFTQITLGGEPVDQAILDLLHASFPGARVSWIYASSEAGASIAVHDGRAGFPTAWLDRADEGRPRLFVEDGELVIESPFRGEGIQARLRTGDRAEIRDDRVLITGRLASDEINVGGSKVSASTVREVLQSHPGVLWAEVKGRKAPVVGTLVQASVVLRDDAVTEAELAQYCDARLDSYAVPRRFRFLTEIPLKESLKSDV
ncbi:MAG TPA: AMP-binding protein [Arachnia sp.]|nr:AMP-binding protein [Arachnia sp.]HMT85102.1 AMP-binding protein [Arachnia sp.]